jgi:hypothetical protein
VQQRPHTRQTARAAFYQGFIERIGARLVEAHDDAVTEAAGARSVAGVDGAPEGRPIDGQVAGSPAPATAVVLAEKAAEVQAFYRQTTSARGSWKGYRGVAGGDSGAARGAGRAAASQARIGPQRGIGGSGPELTP